MTSRFSLALAALSLFAAAVARAESAPARSPAHRPIAPIVAALDRNHDGTLSAAEIAAAPLALAALDLNGDGMISPDEWQTSHADGTSTRRGAVSVNVVLALDANHDGDIQLMEIANAVSSLKQLDRNGDGQLTPDELRPTLVAHLRT